jgi:hypothetical protein
MVLMVRIDEENETKHLVDAGFGEPAILTHYRTTPEGMASGSSTMAKTRYSNG